MVDTKDVTFIEWRVVKPSLRPYYIEFELDDEAILNDLQKEDGDEKDNVESDNKMNDRERVVRDIVDERYIEERS